MPNLVSKLFTPEPVAPAHPLPAARSTSELLARFPRLAERVAIIEESAAIAGAAHNGAAGFYESRREDHQAAQARLGRLVNDFAGAPVQDDTGVDRTTLPPGRYVLKSTQTEVETAVSSTFEAMNRAAVMHKRTAGEKAATLHMAEAVAALLAHTVKVGAAVQEVDIDVPEGADATTLEERGTRIKRELSNVRGALDTGARDRIPELVAKLAEAPRLSVGGHGRTLAIRPPLALTSAARAAAGVPATAPDALALLAWADPEKLIAEMQQQFDQMAAGRVMLTPAQRREKIAHFEAELLLLDRVEAELVWATYTEGKALVFRRGLDPRAVLGLGGVDLPKDR